MTTDQIIIVFLIAVLGGLLIWGLTVLRKLLKGDFDQVKHPTPNGRPSIDPVSSHIGGPGSDGN